MVNAVVKNTVLATARAGDGSDDEDGTTDVAAAMESTYQTAAASSTGLDFIKGLAASAAVAPVKVRTTL